ncbi:DNA polymerase II [Alteromonas confluentis]|uniref:DNA polymerase n=1 Tax=Alteromonas confluentis TaxID=1656094 RepID=A0A1E7Z8Y9_9ALTE|nr:DNA polymerase II [Alteromonas confluentis]OFC69864.1 DNA polymerase II [Alteromonas confluentis]
MSLHTTRTETGYGFVLTRRTVRQGNVERIELWVATETGPLRLLSEPQSNVCFVCNDHVDQIKQIALKQNLNVTYETVSVKTLEQKPVTLIRSNLDLTQSKLRRAAEAQFIPLYEGDIKSVDRFLMERFAYGSISFQGTRHGSTIEDAKVKGAPFRTTLNVISFDIECDEHQYLYSIAIASEKLNCVFLNTAETASVKKIDQRFDVINLADEKSVLEAFSNAIQDIDPDVILGWNVKQFDLAVLNSIAKRLGVSLRLGRGNEPLSIREWDNGAQVIAEIPGRSIIDGIEALKTMTYQFERFTLDHVAHALLGEGKLIESDDRLEEIKSLYRDEPEQLVAYNYQDCVLVNRIAQQTGFIDFLMLRSTLTGLDMSRPGGSVAAFINVYLPKLHRAGYVCGVRPENGGLASPGGYVMSSKPGLYDNVLVLDFKSLYPSIIRTFLIDPLGLAEGLLHPQNAIEGFRGARFSRQQNFLPDIIANLWRQRDEAKRQKDAARSQAIKILMNSFYGVLGSGGCPFYDPRLASSITLRGHEIMQTTAKWIEGEGYEVIYGDTDSTFVFIGDNHNSDAARTIGLHLQTLINTKWQQRLDAEFNLPCHLEIEFETHFRRFFMPTIRGSEEGSKKRYAGLIDRDGEETVVFKGLENVRSDWTALARKFQEDLYTRIFANEPVKTYIRDLLAAIRAGQKDEQLVYARRLRKPLSSYTRSQPPHVKAARQADEINTATGKKLRYQHRTTVRYMMTLGGPQTVESVNQPLDYEHYVEKQIRPIADSILPAVGLRFEDIDNQQLGLF